MEGVESWTWEQSKQTDCFCVLLPNMHKEKKKPLVGTIHARLQRKHGTYQDKTTTAAPGYPQSDLPSPFKMSDPRVPC